MAFDSTRISLGLSVTLDPATGKTILRGMGVVPTNCFKKDGAVLIGPPSGMAADPGVLSVQCVAKADATNRLCTAIPTPVEFRKVLRAADLKGVTAITGWLMVGDHPVASDSIAPPQAAHLEKAADFDGEAVVAAGAKSPFKVATALVAPVPTAAVANFTPLPLPNPGDRDTGFGLPGAGNFPGKGGVATWKTRPVDPWDLISKIHDMLYQVNNLTFMLGPQATLEATSRQAKCDYMFRVLTLKVSDQLNPPQAFWNYLADLAFKGRDASQFIAGDGFANVLVDPGFTSPKYLLLPYDALPKNEQASKTITYDRGPRGTPPIQSRWNDYETAYPEDNDWEVYPKQKFGDIWDFVKRVTSDADHTFG